MKPHYRMETNNSKSNNKHGSDNNSSDDMYETMILFEYFQLVTIINYYTPIHELSLVLNCFIST